MQYLGVDFGERWVGLAISDPLGMFASPLETLRVKNFEEAVTRTAEAACNAKVEKVIVGHARDLSGKRGTKAKECEAFAEALRATGLTIELWDERLTTAQAERSLLSANLSHRKRKMKLDSVAAQIILQSYLQAKG